MLYFATQLGDKTFETPQGFLLCLDVPIARTGTQIYQAGELDIDVGPDGQAYLERTPDEVFNPESIKSANGCTFTDEHVYQPGGVTVDNWRDVAAGYTMNPRRGANDQPDLLLADIMITAPETIANYRNGKRQISCGYDYKIVRTGPGRGFVTNIIYNHVALVDRARCGSVCSIHDSQNSRGGHMNATWKKLVDSIRGTVEVKDKAKFDAALDEAGKLIKDEDPAAATPGGGVNIHLNGNGGKEGYAKDEIDAKFKEHDDKLKAHDEQIKKCMDSLFPANNGGGGENTEEKKAEEEMKDEAEPGKEEEMKKATDSKLLADSFQRTIAAAELLVPGITLPAFDSTAPKLTTYKSICAFRRQVLTKGLKDEETKGIILDSRGGRALDSAQLTTMPCGQVTTLFFAAAGVKKRMNNDSATRNVGVDITRNGGSFGSEQDRIKAINKANRERFSK